METDLAKLLAKKFVQRRDVKSVQTANGKYHPIHEKWKMSDFNEHLAGVSTFGHYLCDQDSKVKLFAFDIDLAKTGTWVEWPDLSTLPDDALRGPDAEDWFAATTIVHQSTPRTDWLDRRHPGREWYKLQLRSMAEVLSSAVRRELDIPVATAYSGNKGLHVYGFTGEMDASTARAGALLAMETAANTWSERSEFVKERAHYFYRNEHRTEPESDWRNLTIEVYPKQDEISSPEGLGNLMRLPLGKNMKNPKDPTFFLDQRAPHNMLVPHPDPAALLNGKSPWKD